MGSKKIKSLFVALAVLSVVMLAWPSEASGYSGLVTVDEVTAQAGAKVAVAVRLSGNDAQVAGVVVPLKYSGTGVILDSISYVGSLLGPLFTKIDTIMHAEKSLRFVAIPDPANSEIPTITATSGLLATLHFSIAPNAGAQNVMIDSINRSELIVGNIYKTIRIEFSERTGTLTLYPEYNPGSITVQSPTGIDEDELIPLEFAVHQNYPNPFNPVTAISYAIPSAGLVQLEVFNVLGQTVATLVNQRQAAGNYTVEFDASLHPSGVYFYRVSHATGVETRKMLLLK